MVAQGAHGRRVVVHHVTVDLHEAVAHEQRVVGVDVDHEGRRCVALLGAAVLIELGHAEQLVGTVSDGELHERGAREQLATRRDQLVLDDAIGRVGPAGGHEAQLLDGRHGEQVEDVDDIGHDMTLSVVEGAGDAGVQCSALSSRTAPSS